MPSRQKNQDSPERDTQAQAPTSGRQPANNPNQPRDKSGKYTQDKTQDKSRSAGDQVGNR